MVLGIEIIVTVGFLLSLYAFYVERKSSKIKDYKAVCDMGGGASCTKAFKSKYGKFIGLPTSIWGMIFYILIFVLVSLNYLNIVFYLSILAVLGSIYLAYVSYFKLKNLCIICTGVYIVNILLFVYSI